MKLTRQSVLAGATLVIGGMLGASALVAMAQTSGLPLPPPPPPTGVTALTNTPTGVTAPANTQTGWNPPSQTPPNGNVAAPINVGVSGINNVQEKLDSLMIDGNFGLLGNFVYRPSGAAPTPGQVLMAQASSTNPSVSDGTVTWGNAGSGTYNSSLTTNGYQVFPNGLILEWGKITTGSTFNNKIATTSFPKTFPNQAFSITVTAGEKGNGSGDKQSQWGGTIIDNGTFQYYAQYENPDPGPFDLYWMATGW